MQSEPEVFLLWHTTTKSLVTVYKTREAANKELETVDPAYRYRYSVECVPLYE